MFVGCRAQYKQSQTHRPAPLSMYSLNWITSPGNSVCPWCKQNKQNPTKETITTKGKQMKKFLFFIITIQSFTIILRLHSYLFSFSRYIVLMASWWEKYTFCVNLLPQLVIDSYILYRILFFQGLHIHSLQSSSNLPPLTPIIEPINPNFSNYFCLQLFKEYLLETNSKSGSLSS